MKGASFDQLQGAKNVMSVLDERSNIHNLEFFIENGNIVQKYFL